MTTVLIEASSALTRMDLAEELAAASYRVLTCSGRPEGACPLLRGEGCSLMDEADVVINALTDHQLEIYVAQQHGWPSTPTLVLTEGWKADVMEDLGVSMDAAPVTTGGFDLLRHVRRLLRTSEES